ncbi:MAG: sigma-54-dependent transcriptional regulator [Phycisphaerae bacterium]
MSQPKMTVLVVDDEPIKRVTLQIELGEAGYEVVDAADAQIALRLMEGRTFDVVLTDLRMPGIDGIAFLDEIKRRSPGTYVILMTAYGTVDTAVEAIKRGAYDYVTKPFLTATLLEKLDRIASYRVSEQARDAAETGLGRLVGTSHGMRQLFDQVRAAAADAEPVLIFGEAGTGKTSVAETIHQLSGRRSAPLVRVNCETVTDRTSAAELFGPEANTPDRRPTLLEQAADGSLLLENVDRLPQAVQARFVHAMESLPADAGPGRGTSGPRLISTTKAALLDAVRRGGFREDLFYRLSARTLSVPSLRDRRDDIPVLVRAFLARHAALAPAAAGRTPAISAHALDLLMAYHWPGNVAELEHAVEQALTRCDGQEIRPEHLPASLCAADPGQMAVSVPEVGLGLNQTVSDVERMLIEAALRHASGNQARAAQILRIPRTTLRDKMTKYGLVGDAPSCAP